MQLCGICGGNHGPMDCDIVTIVSHIPDKIIPSKAKLTLPEDLILTKMADDTYTVCAAYSIVKGTQFGPLQAKKLCSLLPSISFPVRVFTKTEDIFSEYFLDTSNENECNWMMFVNPATDFQEQNVICYQDNEDIYFVTVKDICEGEILKVWYSPYYATKMQKDEQLKHVNVDNTDCVDNNTTSVYNKCIDNMVRKKKTITPRKTWSCKFCGKLEANLSEFARHLIKHYQKKRLRFCEICNFSFAKIQAVMTDTTKNFQPPIIQPMSIPPIERHWGIGMGGIRTGVEYNYNSPIGCGASGIRTAPCLEKIQPQLEILKNNGISSFQKHMKIVHANNVPDREPVPKPNTLTNIDINTDSLPKQVYLGGPLLLNNLLTDSMDNAGLDLDLSGIENQSNLIDNENLNLNVESILPESVNDLENFNFELTENENEQFVCDICVKSFRTVKLLIIHMNIHIGKYPCFSCNQVFARKENLTSHLCNVFYKHRCSACSRMFYQKKYLANHMKKSHGPKKPKTKPSKTFQCPKCPTKFTHQNNLYIHLKAHQSPQNYTCPICNKMLNSRKTYLKHYKLHDEPGHKCEICEKIFKRKDTLRYHVETTHTAKLEICAICKKAVKTKKLLRAHMKQHEERSFKCSQCPDVFKQQHNMIRHMKTVHEINRSIESFCSNIDKQYTCHKCPKKFSLPKSLTRHMKSQHPDEKVEHRITNPEINRSIQSSCSNIDKQYACHKCPRKFKLSHYLERHLKTHHSEEKIEHSITNHEVNTSIESFSSNFDKQYTCHKCSKMFKFRYSLTRHINSHCSEKKIEQNITNLEVNSSVESSCSNIDKQYTCHKCLRKFKLSYSLRRHMKSHHPEEKIEQREETVRKPQVDDSVMDLKQTIENMNFATDEINNEIDKLLNNPENFGSDSNDRMMEHLINTVVGETNLANNLEHTDTLSMPNLDLDDVIN